MLKAAKTVGLLTIAIIGIGILGPWLAGIYIQKNVAPMLDFYNSLPGIHVQQINYSRHWFSSDSIIQVEISHPQYFNMLNQLGIDKQAALKTYIIDQHIQHGPFIYSKQVGSFFGIAITQNVLRQTPDVREFFSRLGLSSHFIEQNTGFVSLLGNYSHHLKLSGIHLIYSEDTSFKTGIIDCRIGLNPSNQRIHGDLTIHSMMARADGDSIFLPDINYQFDIFPDKYDWWSGTSSLKMSQMQAIAAEGLSAELSDVYYHSDSHIISNQFSTTRQINIGKLFFNGQELGSIHLKGSINQLNAKTLANIFAVYHEITKRGELYPSQLKQNIENLIPTVVNSGSYVTLDALNIDTATGRLQMNGELQWNMNNESIPDEMSDLITSANAQLNLKISKTLMDKFIDFYVTSPLINDVGFDLDNDDLNYATDNIYYNMQSNALLIDLLVRNAQLRDADAEDLLNLQKNMVPIKEYANKINNILWEKYMTLVTSYVLYWGYVGVENSIVEFEKMVHANQDQAKLNLHAQINWLLKKGYLLENKNDYFISVKQAEGIIKLNGKSVK
jgi:hypothetical protein